MAGRRVTDSTEILYSPGDLPVDRVKLRDLIESNGVGNVEVRIYGRKRGKEEQAIREYVRNLGIDPTIKESEEKKHVIVKLKNHLKFVILKIEDENRTQENISR